MIRYRALTLGLAIAVTAFSIHATASKKKPTAPSLPAAYHNNQGAVLLVRGELQKAEFELKTAIELSPDYAEAYSNLGLVYKQEKRYDEALANFTKATQLKPDYASAYNHIGTVYIAQQKYDDAIKAIRTAIAKNRTFADAYYDLGLAYLGLYSDSGYKDTGKRDQAEILFKRATEINPRLVDVHAALAQLYLDKGDIEKATIRQSLVLELNPASVESWKKMGEIYERTGDKEKAQLSFAHAKEIQEAPQKAAQADATTVATTEFTAGTQLMEQGDKALQNRNTANAKKYFTDAIPHFQAALQANPKLFDAQYNLGLALFQTGDSDGALKTWKSLLSQSPDYMRATYNVGMVNWRNGKIKEAIPYLCKFLQKGSKDFSNEVKSLTAEMAKNNMVCP